jgi:hypothetical protein
MNAIAFSLIACGGLFNCCAIVFLLMEKRAREAHKKIFLKNLDEIAYHLHGIRMSKTTGISQTSQSERKGKL